MYKRPRIIPCLLIDDGNLVKTKQFKKPVYLGDPINAVKIFNEEEADELCLLDISSHRNQRINFELLESIASEAFMPLAYGGGIKSMDDVKRLFRMGFEKLVFNSMLVANPELIKQVVEFAGSQSVVASIDVKKSVLGKEFCFIECGKKNTKKDCITFLHEIEKLGVGEIFINSIDNDGMMQGYDLRLIKRVVSETNLPVIACGGAGNLHDLNLAIKQGGAQAVAAGSIFVFYGPRKAVLINYPAEEELNSIGLGESEN